jgi:hypothetical protein
MQDDQDKKGLMHRRSSGMTALALLGFAWDMDLPILAQRQATS